MQQIEIMKQIEIMEQIEIMKQMWRGQLNKIVHSIIWKIMKVIILLGNGRTSVEFRNVEIIFPDRDRCVAVERYVQ